MALGKNAIWLNYHHLYYFYKIAMTGSLTKAASGLGVGPATLSVSLKLLEEALEQSLFERRGKRLILTESGQMVFDYAREIFRLGAEMLEVVKDSPTQTRPQLHIGALDGVPKAVFVQVVDRALRERESQIVTLEGKGEALFHELSLHQLDLVVSNFPPAAFTDAKFYSRSLGRLPVIVCGSAKYKNLAKDFPNSLMGQPVILPTGHSQLRHDLDHFFQKHRIVMDVIAESQDGSVQKILGEKGLGLFPVSKMAVQDEIEKKELFEIGVLKGVFEEIWLVAAQRRIQNPQAQKIFDSQWRLI